MGINKSKFTINFVGLQLGKHQFEYAIKNTFFEDLGYQEFLDVDISANVLLNKKNTQLELDISTKGHVEVECDITLEAFPLKIENSLKIIVKFGDKFEELDENLILIPRNAHEIDIQQYIYESVLLAIPSKCIHPGVLDGTLDSEIFHKLNKYSIDNNQKIKNNKTDPRWDQLKKLL